MSRDHPSRRNRQERKQLKDDLEYSRVWPKRVNSLTPILPTNIVSIKDINGSANNAPKAGTAKPNISFVSDPSSIMESFTNLVVATVVVEALSPDKRRRVFRPSRRRRSRDPPLRPPTRNPPAETRLATTGRNSSSRPFATTY